MWERIVWHKVSHNGLVLRMMQNVLSDLDWLSVQYHSDFPIASRCLNIVSVLESSHLITVNWFLFQARQLFNFLLEVYIWWGCLQFGRIPEKSIESLIGWSLLETLPNTVIGSTSSECWLLTIPTGGKSTYEDKIFFYESSSILMSFLLLTFLFSAV